MLGLPDSISACLFDLDGVLTDTARVHRAAWANAFNPILKAQGQQAFSDQDYNEYVDGKRRLDGVRDFLASRGIRPAEDEIKAIADRKNERVVRLIETKGVRVFPGSLRYLAAVVDVGLLRVVVSASANTEAVLRTTGLDDLLDGYIDGNVAEKMQLAGKPAPDTYLAGAGMLDVPPAQAVVFEDALAGVEAGKRGQFGYVVGVNRLDESHGAELGRRGADVVVTDLADLLASG